jgi:parvulin-like peptidyl-prolyl isomerase
MAKAKSQPAPQARPKRRSTARVDPDRVNRLLILGGVAAVILIAIGVIGYGWYATHIKPLGRTVLQVGDAKVSLGHLERRMSMRYDSNPLAYNTDTILSLPDEVYNTLQYELILLQAAPQIDVEVTDEELDTEIRNRGSLAPDAQPQLVAQAFRRQVDDSGLKADEYRQMVRAELLREKVLNYFVFLAPSAETQVRVQWMVFESKEEADAALARVNGGEDFATVANEVSIQSQSAQDGGIVEWSPRGTYPDEKIETFLFDDAAPDEVSDVLVTDQFYYVIKLLGREVDRPLDEGQRRLVANRAMTDWLDEAQQEIGVEQHFSDEDAVRAINDIL